MANREQRRAAGKATRKAAKAQQTSREVTPAAAWNKAKRDNTLTIEVPSGNVCRIRPLAPEDFFSLSASGNVPNALLGIVQGAIDDASGSKPKSAEDIAKESLESAGTADMMELVDAMVVSCVVEPQVSPPPTCRQCGSTESFWTRSAVHTPGSEEFGHAYDVERDESLLYVDEVDLMDKMFIFQFASGGTADPAQFRDEQGSLVERLGSLSEGSDETV